MRHIWDAYKPGYPDFVILIAEMIKNRKGPDKKTGKLKIVTLEFTRFRILN